MRRIVQTLAVLVVGGAVLFPAQSAQACHLCRHRKVCCIPAGYGAPTGGGAQPYGYSVTQPGATPYGYSGATPYGYSGATPYGYTGATPYGYTAATPYGYTAATPYGYSGVTPYGYSGVTPYGYSGVNPQGIPLAPLFNFASQAFGAAGNFLGGGNPFQGAQGGQPAQGAQGAAPGVTQFTQPGGQPAPVAIAPRMVIDVITHQGDPVTTPPAAAGSDAALTKRVADLENSLKSVTESLDSISKTLADAKKAGKL